MIVCVCKAVNDRAIRLAIAEGHDTFDALQFELGVGMNCGRCVSAACELLCEPQVESSDRCVDANAQTRSSPLRFIARPSSREVAIA